MSKLLLLREPGYVYDLEFIFCLHFNFDLYMSKLPDDETRKENVKYYKHVLAYFGDIPDELYVFFHALRSTERAFLPWYSFYPYQSIFSTTYNFNFMNSQLQKNDKLVRGIIKFYFNELDDEGINNCMESMTDMFALIKNSNYSNEEKIKLYEFFADPITYIELLKQELTKKESMLSDYYNKNYNKILNIYSNSDFDTIRNDLDGIIDFNAIYDDKLNSFVSYCLINMSLICICCCAKQELVSLLGYRYSLFLDFAKNKQKKPDLLGFGTAFSEENRVKMLQYILEHTEVTCKDLEQAFQINGSTIYHHISIMVHVGVINAKYKGKSIFYSINKDYFDNVLYNLSKYSNRWIGK